MAETKAVSSLSDDALSQELFYWIRVYRNEGFLQPDERKYFKELAAESKKRGLFKRGVSR